MSTVDTKPSMAENPNLQVGTLSVMPPCLWHIWMIAAFGELSKYAWYSQEYEEFLKRFSFILEQRVKTGVW